MPSTRRLATLMFAETVGLPLVDQREEFLLALREKLNEHGARARYVQDG